jgi:tetratricopeptide (TPR) repeat protein
MRDPNVRVQNLQLKVGGRVRPAGWTFAALVVSWLALTTHCALVQWHRAWGRYHLAQAQLTVADLLSDGAGGKIPSGRPHARQEAAADRAYQSFRTADRWGLLGVVELKLGLAAIEIRRHQLDAAEDHLRAALALEPDTPRLYLNLYIFLMQQQRFRDAALVLEDKLAATTPTAEDHFRLAALLLGTNRPRQAVAHYRACLALAPRWGKAHYLLGGLLRRLGQSDEALDHLRLAHRLAPDDPAVALELGLACAAAGARQEALAALRCAARQDPRRLEPYAALIAELEQARAAGMK